MWFMLLAVLALIWNVMGITAFLGTAMMSAEEFAKMTQVQQSLQNSIPIWAKMAFGIAVFTGVFGSLLLVLKKSLALPVLIASLVAVLIQMINFIVLMKGFGSISQGEKIMMIMVIVAAFLLVWLASVAKSKVWLR